MRDHYAAIRDLDAEIIAISTESLEAARGAAANAGLPFPILCDPKHAVIDRYGLFHADEPAGHSASRPALIILDRAGTIRYAHVGEHSRDRPALGVILLALDMLS